MAASRTPEGPLNFCPICRAHCRIEPAHVTGDTVCPRCGALLWSDQGKRKSFHAGNDRVYHLAEEMARLSQIQLTATEYFGECLQRLLSAIAAPAGAVWVRMAQGKLQLQFQINLDLVGLGRDKRTLDMHNLLLAEALKNGQPGLLAPQGTLGSNGAGNPTDFVLLVVPILVDDQVEGLVECWQDPHRGPEHQRGYLQFLVRMAGLASGYARRARER